MQASFLALSACATTPAITESEAGQDASQGAVAREVIAALGTELALHLPPNASPPLPAVLMFHSALGNTAAVRGHADALAELGFAVCVLDFYEGRVASDVEEGRRLRDEANNRLPELTTLVEGAHEALASDPRVQAHRRYLLGWSYGAAWATFAAGFLDRVSGVVAISGEAFSGDPTLIERYSAPLFLVGAAEDTEPSPETLHEVRDAVRDRGGEASVVIVEAAHGFMEPTHPGYAKQPSDRAWAAIVEFLNTHERAEQGAEPGSSI
jgi:dienelactone hydrolase